MDESKGIESVLTEDRVFPPSTEFSSGAHVSDLASYEALVARATEDPVGFWEEQAHSLDWAEKWTEPLTWKEPHAQWFVGGKINASVNCVDRHVKSGAGDKNAIIWEGEPGEVRKVTYRELAESVGRIGRVLDQLGVKSGDRVAIYMPMIPEIAVAMLACSRIGATHTVIFGGFSSEAIRDRINDCGCSVVITADGGYRKGAELPLKNIVDDALENCPSVRAVLVYKRTGSDVPMKQDRDHWWHELERAVSVPIEARPNDSEHPLFILYTSGTTGKPKGILHTTGGYLTQAAYTAKFVFDLKSDDIYWCTADAGWVTGHSYLVYGPLANGATIMMYEGAPNHPTPNRFWQIIERHKVTIFYTAPTAIRAFIKWGDQHPLSHDLTSLRLLGTVGEPINPEAWMWYHRVIGKEKCPIVDTWWQTETGAIMISPLPGAVPTVPGTATRPIPGIIVDVVTKSGKAVPEGEGGYLVVKHPWPSMLRTIWGDDERYKKTYWSEIPGMYFAGDGARKDKRGYFWIMGRVDDVINVSGHRLGTAEVESALVSHPTVAEAAVVGRPDEIKGQAICAFVTLEGGRVGGAELREELRAHVVKEIGALARPDELRFTDALPKTRSGKIMRRLLREIASGGSVAGDVTTLEDLSVLEKLRMDEE